MIHSGHISTARRFPSSHAISRNALVFLMELAGGDEFVENVVIPRHCRGQRWFTIVTGSARRLAAHRGTWCSVAFGRNREAMAARYCVYLLSGLGFCAQIVVMPDSAVPNLAQCRLRVYALLITYPSTIRTLFCLAGTPLPLFPRRPDRLWFSCSFSQLAPWRVHRCVAYVAHVAFHLAAPRARLRVQPISDGH